MPRSVPRKPAARAAGHGRPRRHAPCRPRCFRYNPDADAIDIGGHDFAKRKKFRDVQRTGVAALVVDDVLPPWQPRAVEVRGQATTLDRGGKAIMEGFDDPIIRISPGRIVYWGLEDGFQARSIG